MTDQPIPSSYPCQQCGRRDGLDAAVTDEFWELLTGRDDGGGLLCLWCMDKLAAEKGIVGYVMLHFAGQALVGGNGPTIWDENELTAELLEVNNRCIRLVAERDSAQKVLGEALNAVLLRTPRSVDCLLCGYPVRFDGEPREHREGCPVPAMIQAVEGAE